MANSEESMQPADYASISLAQNYGEHVPWELPVQYCAADCIKSGDTVLDIGGNIGGVAIALSRMTGVNGRVYTFEPNIEMWPHLLENLAINHAENVSHIPLACFSESGKLMKFYSDPSFYKTGSGLMHEIAGAKTFDVVTISVDDFCFSNSLHPSFMKIDVEGAEIHVLRSAEKLLETLHLPVIIEYQVNTHPDGNDSLLYLEKKGYLFFDVNTYERVSTTIYASKVTNFSLVNVLCIHHGTTLAEKYLHLKKELFYKKQVNEKEVLQICDINLLPGRYIVEIDFDCPDSVVGGLAIKNHSGYIAYYEADTKHLKQHTCSTCVININEDQAIGVEFIKKGTYSAGLNKIIISKIVFDI